MSKFCTRGSERGEGWKKKNISNRSALLLKMAAIVASLGRGSRGNSLQGSTSASVLWPLAGSSPSFVEHRILLMTDKILCLLVEIQLLLRAYLEMGTQLKRKLNFLNWKTILASGITVYSYWYNWYKTGINTNFEFPTNCHTVQAPAESAGQTYHTIFRSYYYLLMEPVSGLGHEEEWGGCRGSEPRVNNPSSVLQIPSLLQLTQSPPPVQLVDQ